LLAVVVHAPFVEEPRFRFIERHTPSTTAAALLGALESYQFAQRSTDCACRG
jgi:hypothetical protein